MVVVEEEEEGGGGGGGLPAAVGLPLHVPRLFPQKRPIIERPSFRVPLRPVRPFHFVVLVRPPARARPTATEEEIGLGIGA